MRTFSKLIATAAAGLALMSTAAPAQAALMFAHFSGSVIAGTGSNPGGMNPTYDTFDYFGLGAGLVGADFTATFKYDTNLGEAVTNSQTDSRYGGPGWGCGACISPILEASITLNGITDVFNTSQDGSGNVTVIPDGWKQTFFFTGFFDSSGGNALQLFVLNAPDPLSLTTSYTAGNLEVLGPPDTRPFALGVGAGKNYRLALGPVSTTLVPAPIPEPATWAMMILGFATTGALLRRRRVLALAL